MSQAQEVHLDGEERKWPAMQRCDEFYARYRGVHASPPNPTIAPATSDNKKKTSSTDTSPRILSGG